MTKKLWTYFAMPTLRHILLINPRRCLIEVVSRDAEGRWLSALAQQLDGRLELPALRVELAVADIYAGTAVAA